METVDAKLEELKRTSRILEVVLMIAAAPERYTRKALAERFEISERMIGKDIDIIGWPGRRTQGASDPFNRAINYGYGILYTQVERALLLAGLDPYAGFLHVDRPGKASLVFDLVEEFRQTVVDRTVIAIVNRNMALTLDERGRLVEEARRTLADAIFKRLDAAEPFEGKRYPLRLILQMQARHLATFLRGDRPHYEAFVSSW